MRKAQKRGLKYEKYKARKMRYKHFGGPGKADAGRRKRKVEIKKWKRPVPSGVIKKAIRKGIKTVIAPGGFTAPAKKLAKKARVKLRKH